MQRNKRFGSALSLSVLVIFFALASLLLSGATTAQARSHGRSHKKPNPPAVVASVDGGSITVKDGKVTNTYKVSQFTTVTLNGQPAKITDIVAGMKVSVSASGDNAATRIDAEDASTKHK